MRWRRRARRGLASVAIGLATVVSLTGCFHGDVELSVTGDTVTGTVILAYHRQVLTSTNTSDAQAIENNKAKLPPGPGVSTAPYTVGQYFGTRSRLERVSPSALSHQSGTDPSPIVITHDTRAGTYHVTGAMDFTGLASTSAELAPLLPEFAMRVAITFPGEVIRHNGRLSGRTVTWRPRVGERTTFEAEARDRPPPSPTPSAVASSPAASPPATSSPPSEVARAGAPDVPPPAAVVRDPTRWAWLSILTVGGPLVALLAAATVAVVVSWRRRHGAGPGARPPAGG